MSGFNVTKTGDERQRRGLEIAQRLRLTHTKSGWIVPSQGGKGVYKVGPDLSYCTCPDFEKQRAKCKHIFAVEYTIKGVETPQTASDEPTPQPAQPKVKYTQNWPAYNAAQTSEKARFTELLHSLCQGVPEPRQSLGRPRLPLADRVFCATFKVYSTLSGRRFMCDLYDAWAREYITKVPHYNSMFNYLEMRSLTPLLQNLITQSSLPLRAVETDFAVDSTGFGTSQFIRWLNVRSGQEKGSQDWLKAHVICGVKTNIITSVEVSHGHANDSPFLPALVEDTARHFRVREVSADKGYSSRANVDAIANVGAMPYILFKLQRAAAKATHDGTSTWDRMWHFYHLNQDVFLAHYHKRSNVESTFAMIKGKFGNQLRSKTRPAQVNEVLCKILCHNICVVIQSIYELGIAPVFWEE